MKKKKNLEVYCHFKDNGLTLEQIVKDTFFLYFSEEYAKLKEEYE